MSSTSELKQQLQQAEAEAKSLQQQLAAKDAEVRDLQLKISSTEGSKGRSRGL